MGDVRRENIIRKARGGLPLTAEERAEQDVRRLLVKSRRKIESAPAKKEQPKPVARTRVIRKEGDAVSIEERKMRWREEELALKKAEILAAVEMAKVVERVERDRKPPVINLHTHQAEQRVIIDGHEAEPVG